jgi:hypothetical protein
MKWVQPFDCALERSCCYGELRRDPAPNLKNHTWAKFGASIRLARLHEILPVAVDFDAPQQPPLADFRQAGDDFRPGKRGGLAEYSVLNLRRPPRRHRPDGLWGVVAPLLWLFSGIRAELGHILNFGRLLKRVP